MKSEWKEIEVEWEGERAFTAVNPSGDNLLMGRLGDKQGFSPIEMLLVGLAGCTAYDVIHILAKKRQLPTQFKVTVRGKRGDDHPKVYNEIEIDYLLWGDTLTEKAVQQAIKLSEEKYCSASAMLGKTASISSSCRIIDNAKE